ncbi:hypothetical protein AVEN_60809-1 [Araneus ventricosus]|uniref:Prokineticin domain-containing protein n=1 Tax=Araneus ventricosus TaxID=182803 RepID=A0A4Y2H9J5_ARAVE|nr:hypothetical protein AVEN_60809-1 [Araneus ventricosus]
MKFLLVACLLTVFLALGAAEKCRSSDDCEADECCISKRFLIFSRGECVKLAQRGEKCSEEHEAHGFFDQQYEHHCPCASGLTCEPTESRDTWFGTIKVNPRCVGDLAHTTPAETTAEKLETSPEPETAAPTEA